MPAAIVHTTKVNNVAVRVVNSMRQTIYDRHTQTYNNCFVCINSGRRTLPVLTHLRHYCNTGTGTSTGYPGRRHYRYKPKQTRFLGPNAALPSWLSFSLPLRTLRRPSLDNLCYTFHRVATPTTWTVFHWPVTGWLADAGYYILGYLNVHPVVLSKLLYSPRLALTYCTFEHV